MSADETRGFLSHLAVSERVSASTQNQALCALLFLDGRVLARDVGLIEGIERAKAPKRLPVVLTRGEVKAVLDKMDGVPQLVCRFLYAGGLRLAECLSLRGNDIDLERHHLHETVQKAMAEAVRRAEPPRRPRRIRSVRRP
jgi:integrase